MRYYTNNNDDYTDYTYIALVLLVILMMFIRLNNGLVSKGTHSMCVYNRAYALFNRRVSVRS